jgi:N-acetylmuramoyl-L-alanine amidase
MSSEQPMLVVVLDPGHGGAVKTGGSSPNNARGPNGLLEKDLTLDLATRTAALLSTSARVVMTRTSDVNLSLSDRAAVSRANKADVFVSIHLNGFHDASVDGTEVWISRSAGDASAQLAGEVLTELAAVTEAPNRGVRRSDLGVLLPARHAPTTAACLAEITFLTNPSEASRLAGDAYRQQIARALATAILSRARVPAAVGGPASSAPPARSQGVGWFVTDRLVRYFRDEAAQGIPLDPGVGGQSIGEDALQAGDIIVSTTDQLSSRGIRFGTGSQVSHAKLYIGDGQVVEAVGQGVKMPSLARSLAQDSLAVAFRYPGITQEQQLMVRDFAGQQLEKHYNYVGIVRQALFQVERTNCDALPDDLAGVCRSWVGGIVLGPGNNDTFFCSQLVLAAYASAGIPLTSTPPVWGSPEDIAELRLSGQLAYVGHLKAAAASAESFAVRTDLTGGDAEARRQAAAIGGFGSPARPTTTAFDTITLGYGVAGGIITDPFYRDATEKQALTGQRSGRARHLGIDVSTSNAHGGGADDPRRGLPVYAAIAPTIDLHDLNTVRAMRNEEAMSGLGIGGQGTASLRDAMVFLQPWKSQDDGAYGGVVGLACRYGHTTADGSAGIFTLYLEYLHLITSAFLPKDGQGRVISAESWAATGKGTGFGPRMHDGAHLSANDLTGGDPLLVGYLGATQFPHVHIQAAYGGGEQGYLRTPRFDPTVMLRSSASTTQAWALSVPSLSLNDQSFHYDVPGTFEPLVQPSSMACWATAATMLINWRDQASHPIGAVCNMAGPIYRNYFDNNTGLPRADKPGFLQRLGLQEEPPACYRIDAYRDLLRTYGPLWVSADVGSPGTVSIHARVMTGIYGDGSADNSFVWLIDPVDGQRHSETFAHFSATLEQLARDVGATEPLWVQIVHNPPSPS